MVTGNKRGFMRILEATIGVLLVTSVLLVVYVNQQPPQFLSSVDYIFNLQKQILLDISSRSDLRGYVLSGDNASLDSYLDIKIPDAYRYSLITCNLNETGTCKLSTSDVVATRSKDVFVEEIIIAADFETGYSPKKVRFFIWENR
ncbi:MAG: hypothetical protein IH845_02865 [Nanoarchaeota archaeon]|nr:hypothetical protein [Nanoarchaeota archaeon]